MRQVLEGLLYDTEKATMVYRSKDKTKTVWQMNNSKTFFFTFEDGHIEPTTRDAVKKYLGLVDVPTYIRMFGDPEEA